MPSAVDFESLLSDHLLADTGIAAIVGNKVFALVIPEGTVLPCLSFQRLSGQPANTLSGHSGLEAITVQIDAWGRTYSETKELAKAVRAAMPAQGAVWGAHLMEDQDFFEDGTNLRNYYRVSMEYLVWFLETE